MQEQKVLIRKQNRTGKIQSGGGGWRGSSMKVGHMKLVILRLRPSPIQQLKIKLLSILAIRIILLHKIIQNVHNVYGNDWHKVRAKMS